MAITGIKQAEKEYPRFMSYKYKEADGNFVIEILSGNRIKLKINNKQYIYSEGDVRMMELALRLKDHQEFVKELNENK